MPEMPEVETIRRNLEATIVGREITLVSVLDARLVQGASVRAFRSLLEGASVTGTDRRGKYLLIGLDRGWLVLHLMMSGRIHLRDSPAVRSHTRMAVEFDSGPSLHFVDTRRFGRAWAPDRERLADLLSRIGPEPLSPAFTADTLRGGFCGRSVAVKPALLDQRTVAGIGNIYADEALWLARIHPETPAGSLRAPRLEALREAIVAVLRDGIAHGGTSFRTYEDSRGRPGSHQRWLQVFGRTDGPCGRCGRPIRRIVVGQRGTHLCPRCQRRPRLDRLAQRRPPRASGA